MRDRPEEEIKFIGTLIAEGENPNRIKEKYIEKFKKVISYLTVKKNS